MELGDQDGRSAALEAAGLLRQSSWSLVLCAESGKVRSKEAV